MWGGWYVYSSSRVAGDCRCCRVGRGGDGRFRHVGCGGSVAGGDGDAEHESCRFAAGNRDRLGFQRERADRDGAVSVGALNQADCDLSTLVYTQSDANGAFTLTRYVRRLIAVSGPRWMRRAGRLHPGCGEHCQLERGERAGDLLQPEHSAQGPEDHRHAAHQRR